MGNRNRSLYGKILLTKTLLLSQLSYALQMLALPWHVLSHVNSIIHTFLWKKKYNNKRAYEKLKAVCSVSPFTKKD